MYAFFAHAMTDVLQLIVKVVVFSFQSYCFHVICSRTKPPTKHVGGDSQATLHDLNTSCLSLVGFGQSHLAFCIFVSK